MDSDELNRDRFKCCGLAAANRDTNQLNNRDLEKQPNHLGRFVPADEPRIAGWPDGDTSRFVPADVAGMEWNHLQVTCRCTAGWKQEGVRHWRRRCGRQDAVAPRG
jgi:hypothetical protein